MIQLRAAVGLALGLLLLGAPLSVNAAAAPGESRLVPREDGTYAAVPEVHGRTKIFRLVSRNAPWTLKPGLTVAARTYNGVVPGPTLVVDQGDRVVIDYTNEMEVPDTIHLHGIRGGPPEMDGVAGISQSLVRQHEHFRYAFTAGEDGTFMYHSHGSETMVDAGLYGGIIVRPTQPRAVERGLGGDYLEMLSAWQIDSAGENHFTLNGKEYPAAREIEVRRGERVRIRWVNISSENDHTMHTHGHDQRVIARDARPVSADDVEDTVMLGAGQRVDTIVTADATPGTWLVHCHLMDHTQDADGMPQGLITALHYRGTPHRVAAMGEAMRAGMPMPASMKMGGPSRRTVIVSSLLVFTGFAGGVAWSRGRRARLF
jgi:FtsP/CotA-like multicopper oxidase with cupredoxin domain